jgi:hypothetical protein
MPSGGGDSWFGASKMLASKGSRVAQTNYADDGRTWMVGWDADSLDELDLGAQKLEFGSMKTKSGHSYDTSHVGDLTYLLMEGTHAVDKTPWSGQGTAADYETDHYHSKSLWSRTMDLFGGSNPPPAPPPAPLPVPANNPAPAPTYAPPTQPMPVLRDSHGDDSTKLPPMHQYFDNEDDNTVEKVVCGPNSFLNKITGLCEAIHPDGTLSTPYWIMLYGMGVLIFMSALRYVKLAELPWDKLSITGLMRSGQGYSSVGQDENTGFQMTGMADGFDDDL